MIWTPSFLVVCFWFVPSLLEQRQTNNNKQNSRRRLIDDLRQELQKQQNDNNNNQEANKIQWTLDANVEDIRQVIGNSFAGDATKGIAGEPFYEWGLSHVAWFSQEEKVATIRYMASLPFVEDTIINTKDVVSFQLCAVTTTTTTTTGVAGSSSQDVVVAFASVQEYDAKERAAKQRQLKKLPFAVQKIQKSIKRKKTSMYLAANEKDKSPSSSIPPPLFKDKNRRSDLLRFWSKIPNFVERATKWHEQVGPPGKHWYVRILGVNPAYQGQGYGRELLQQLNKLADSQQQSMYLQCGGNDNMRFYEKHGQFKVVETHPFYDPEEAQEKHNKGQVFTGTSEPMPMHLMIRQPIHKQTPESSQTTTTTTTATNDPAVA